MTAARMANVDSEPILKIIGLKLISIHRVGGTADVHFSASSLHGWISALTAAGPIHATCQSEQVAYMPTQRKLAAFIDAPQVVQLAA